MLRKLDVAPAGSMAGYSREEFPHWASDGTEFGWEEPDGSCDVRDDALVRDGRGVEVDEECSITAGEWLDPYTGATLTDSEDVDIDHVVPLANAWRSGASNWDESRKEAYANDPGVLLSVDDAANQTKGDKGPEAWLPPNADYRCEYARRWISIKHRWNLTVNAQEKSTLKVDPARDATGLRISVSGAQRNPSAELISPLTSTTGGVMTDEVGAITGELELLTHHTGGHIEAQVRYAGSRDLYTVTGSPVQSTEPYHKAHGTILERLTTPGGIEDGNELPVDVTNIFSS